jgi:hypothetical protein
VYKNISYQLGGTLGRSEMCTSLNGKGQFAKPVDGKVT